MKMMMKRMKERRIYIALLLLQFKKKLLPLESLTSIAPFFATAKTLIQQLQERAVHYKYNYFFLSSLSLSLSLFSIELDRLIIDELPELSI